MKKNRFKIISVVLILMMCLFVFSNVAHAEEQVTETEDVVTEEVVEDVTQEPTEDIEEPVVDEVVDVVVDEEQVSVGDMIREFIDKWIIAILATFGGGFGTAIVVVLSKSAFEKILECTKKSLEANEESNDALNKAKGVIADGLEKIEEGVAKFEEKMEGKIADTTENINNCLKEITDMKNQNSQFKELIALLVTSNPQLASNGYATKILELLNEGSESNE